jgi:hypothetical protein
MSCEDEGFVHKLTISNPGLADMGKYTCEVNGVVTEAFLEVEGKQISRQQLVFSRYIVTPLKSHLFIKNG